MSDEKTTTPEKETPKEDTGLKFKLKPVTKKPPRRFKKGSKYDPLIDAFLKSKNTLVEVSVTEKDHNYLRNQLNKRIEARGLQAKMKTSVVNVTCYLEKL